MGNPADATRVDPYGEFGHVETTSLVVAARLYREAINTGREMMNTKERVQLMAEAQYRLMQAAYEDK